MGRPLGGRGRGLGALFFFEGERGVVSFFLKEMGWRGGMIVEEFWVSKANLI